MKNGLSLVLVPLFVRPNPRARVFSLGVGRTVPKLSHYWTKPYRGKPDQKQAIKKMAIYICDGPNNCTNRISCCKVAVPSAMLHALLLDGAFCLNPTCLVQGCRHGVGARKRRSRRRETRQYPCLCLPSLILRSDFGIGMLLCDTTTDVTFLSKRLKTSRTCLIDHFLIPWETAECRLGSCFSTAQHGWHLHTLGMICRLDEPLELMGCLPCGKITERLLGGSEKSGFLGQIPTYTLP